MKKQAKKSKQKPKRKKAAKKEERPGMNIKQMLVRSAIREGFRLAELALLFGGGALLGIRLTT